LGICLLHIKTFSLTQPLFAVKKKMLKPYAVIDSPIHGKHDGANLSTVLLFVCELQLFLVSTFNWGRPEQAQHKAVVTVCCMRALMPRILWCKHGKLHTGWLFCMLYECHVPKNFYCSLVLGGIPVYLSFTIFN